MKLSVRDTDAASVEVRLARGRPSTLVSAMKGLQGRTRWGIWKDLSRYMAIAVGGYVLQGNSRFIRAYTSSGNMMFI